MIFTASIARADETIVITGSRLSVAPSEASYSTSIISADRLDTAASTQLDDILRRESGFQLFRRISSRVLNASAQGVSLRALGGTATSRALVLLDGVPLTDPFGAWVPWSALRANDLASVRLQRGGGSVAAGEGALTGVIDLVSAQIVNGWAGRVESSCGSYSSVDSTARVSWRHSAWSVAIFGASRHSDGYGLIAPEQSGPVDIAAKSEARAFSAKAAYSFDNSLSIESSVLVYDEHKNNGLAISNNSNRGTDVALRLVRERSADWSLDAVAWFKSRNFSSGFASVNSTRTMATLSSSQDAVPAQGYGARFEIRPPSSGPWHVRIGSEVRVADGETQERVKPVNGIFQTRRSAGGTQNVLGGFIDADVEPVRWLTLTAGSRLDGWRQYNGHRLDTDVPSGVVILSQITPSRSGTQWTGRVGSVVALTSALSTRVATYTGWRLPTLNELYRPFRVGNDITSANPDLKPERLRGIDGGLHFQPFPGWQADITGFANWLDDAITNLTLGPGANGTTLRIRQNLPHVRSVGVEASAHARLYYGFALDTSLAYADAKVLGNSTLVGKQLAQSPKLLASATVDWSGFNNAAHAAATVRHGAGQFDDDQNTRRLPAFTTADITLSYELQKRLTLRVSLENLADVRIITAIGADGIKTIGTPRQIFSGFKFGF